MSKRIEYQKFIRNKFEDTRYRELWGLSDNIEIVAEEDIVLQREFRIDFILVKIDESIPLEGIFSYFKKFNHLEVKSINDPLNIKFLWKYISQMGWWFFSCEDEKQRVNPKQVTLTMISVGRPRKVIQFLDEIGVEYIETAGCIQWELMGVEVRILIINRLDIIDENYGWLTLSEGKVFERYTEKLIQEIERDEKYDIYFELLAELEKEGKSRMGERILTRVIDDLSTDQLQRIVSGRVLTRVIDNLTTDQLQRVVSEGVLGRLIESLPPEELQSLVSGSTLDRFVESLPPERLQSVMSGDTLVRFIQNLPSEELRRIRDVLNDIDGFDTASPTQPKGSDNSG